MESVFLIHDFETGSRDPHTTQPIQWAGLALDSRTLKVIDEFEIMMQPELDDEKCAKYGLAPIEDEALAINGHTRKDLEKAAPTKLAWELIVKWVEGISEKTGTFNGPVRVGFNSIRFDDVILDRLMGGHFNHLYRMELELPDDLSEPYKFGPWDDKRHQQKLFNYKQFDIMHQVYSWLESVRRNNAHKYSMDTLREYFGLPMDGAHDALVDVRQEAEIFVRFLKYARAHARNGVFEKSMGTSILEK